MASADEYTNPEKPALDEGNTNPDKENPLAPPQETNEDGTHDLIETIILLLVGAAGGALLIMVINRIRNRRFN